MHIQPEQFVALLAEASGIEEDKILKQLGELITDIKHAIDEGEAYELVGFGIFSQLGNRLVFIPAPELDTEVNFKYVGMEPIEIDQAPPEPSVIPDTEIDPFEDLDEDTDELDDDTKRDPFSGLIEDLDEDEIPEHVDEPAAEDDIFGLADELEEASKILSEDVHEEEEKPGPLQWGISAHKESDDSADRLLSSLMGEKPKEKEEIFSDPDDAFEDPVEDEAEEMDVDPGAEDPEKTLQDDLELVLGDTDEDDFDDPFAGFADEDDDSTEEDELLLDEEDSDDDILPVITNISSDLPEPEKKPEKVKEKKRKEKKTEEKTAEPAPLWMWALLAIVITAGSVVGLGYFNILNIPGISSKPPVTQSQPVTQPPVAPPVEQNTPAEATTPTAQPVKEPVNEPETVQPSVTTGQTATVQAGNPPLTATPLNMPDEVPVGQAAYGLRGVASEAANDGYTIVLYSLSVEENAYREQARLQQLGYRALVTTVPSSQYGTLWRVSIGQFASQRDAAIATDQLDDSFTMNIFIKKITN